MKGIEAADTANILKYICRWSNKNGLQDLEKAAWYLQHLIDHVKKYEEENKNLSNASSASSADTSHKNSYDFAKANVASKI